MKFMQDWFTRKIPLLEKYFGAYDYQWRTYLSETERQQLAVDIFLEVFIGKYSYYIKIMK